MIGRRKQNCAHSADKPRFLHCTNGSNDEDCSALCCLQHLRQPVAGGERPPIRVSDCPVEPWSATISAIMAVWSECGASEAGASDGGGVTELGEVRGVSSAGPLLFILCAESRRCLREKRVITVAKSLDCRCIEESVWRFSSSVRTSSSHIETCDRVVCNDFESNTAEQSTAMSHYSWLKGRV